jgi:large subunit ribosomal protein L29
MTTASELRELEDEELEGRLSEYRRELLNLRFQLATGQLDNHARVSVVRKDLARVLTILRDREIALAEGRPTGPVMVSTRPARPARRRAVEDDDEDEPRAPRARRSQTVTQAEVTDDAEVDEAALEEAALDADLARDEDDADEENE